MSDNGRPFLSGNVAAAPGAPNKKGGEMEAEKKAFKITKREIGFVLGIVVFLLVKFLPLAELSSTVELTVGG